MIISKYRVTAIVIMCEVNQRCLHSLMLTNLLQTHCCTVLYLVFYARIGDFKTNRPVIYFIEYITVPARPFDLTK